MGNAPFISDMHHAETAEKKRYAVIVSGDGLRTHLAKALANRLASRGITTVRVKALKYFWSARSPKAMSQDLGRQLQRRLKNRASDRFLLIGFSFGAGTLPFAVNLLPDDLKSRIDGVALFAPPAASDFEFFLRSWLNKSTKHALLTAPAIQTLSQTLPVLYVRGEADYAGPSDSLQSHDNLTLKTLPGGHHFNKDYGTLISLILERND